jgi:hypothetical protein
MCYNAANHWALNWYIDGRLDLDPPQIPVTVKVAAFVDFQERSSDEYVLLKTGNLYMQYNRAKDYNAGTQQYAYGTALLAGLDTSAGNHIYRGLDVAIEVCSMEQRGDLDYLVISIGTSRTDCGFGFANQADFQHGSANMNDQQWSVSSNWSNQYNKNSQSAKNTWPWNTWNQNNKNSQTTQTTTPWKTSWRNQNNQSNRNSNWSNQNNQNNQSTKNTWLWNSWRSNSSNQNTNNNQWKTNWSNQNNKNSWSPSWNPTTWWNQNNQNNERTGSWNSNQNQKDAYYPGQLSKQEAGLFLSQGLTARIIARQYRPVTYDLGGQSSQPFHEAADAGATYPDNRPDNAGGWIYVR